MKAIFLDFDGVICTDKSRSSAASWLPALEDEAVHLVSKLCLADEESTRIVVSSTWRFLFAKELIVQHLLDYGLAPKFIHEDWRTARINHQCRGAEIQEWLGRHSDFTNFIIIDDRPSQDFLQQQVSQHIQPVSLIGFHHLDYKKASFLLHGILSKTVIESGVSDP